mmetsp:Transcript_6800/g.17019  ORF Transcript_6800/g.17019 Transcript_6800/m.17019 type:complete len:357 (+) Transcript_6800:150-1220(+)
MTEIANQDQTCSVCGIETTRHCSRCSNAYFCSDDCQTKAWPSHEASCSEFVLPELPSGDNDDNETQKQTQTQNDGANSSEIHNTLHRYLIIAANAGNQGHRVRETVLLRRLLQSDNRQPGAHCSLAVACAELGNVAGAVESLGIAVELLLETGSAAAAAPAAAPATSETWAFLAERVVAESIHLASTSASTSASVVVAASAADSIGEAGLALMHRVVDLASLLGDRSLEAGAAMEAASMTMTMTTHAAKGRYEETIALLQRADECWQAKDRGRGRRRHLRALELVPLVLAREAVAADTEAERDAFLERSIAEARVALSAATKKDNDDDADDDADDDDELFSEDGAAAAAAAAEEEG